MSRKRNLERKTNPEIKSLIKELYQKSYSEKVGVWKDIARRLEKPLKNWPGINVSKIEKHLNKEEIALIPGKVLGQGQISKKAVVSAQSFSQQAKKKITEAGGKCLSIKELMSDNPKGKGIRILG
ncbi:MAG TPA: 50S ribosomal protein L18e [Thermoplasmata archaeon]|nr:50S ribosomal protein L18e [Thermoplasmata archaeon]HIH97527.1 50S ribosomal protein L18e [Thermoplasmata archaeon]